MGRATAAADPSPAELVAAALVLFHGRSHLMPHALRRVCAAVPCALAVVVSFAVPSQAADLSGSPRADRLTGTPVRRPDRERQGRRPDPGR